MRLLFLADVLRRAGLTVHEYPGWRERGLASFGPVFGLVCHGTAGRTTISTDLRIIAETGSATATAPIAQLVLDRTGAWHVVASGTCTGVKTGTGGPLAGRGDDSVLQIEACHAATEPWTDVQYHSYVRGVAALIAYREPGYEIPLQNVVGHGEHQPGEKTDPWFNMNTFRRDVATVLSGGTMTPAQEESLLTQTHATHETIRWEIRAWTGATLNAVNRLEAASAADATRDAAMLKAIEALAAAGGVDAAPIVAAVKAEGETTRTRLLAEIEQRHQVEMAALRKSLEAEMAGLVAELERLKAQ